MSEPTREQKMAAARSRMAELAAKFLERTAGDIASMRDGLDKLSSGDATALADIRHLAHRMVGTGATLGFESLAECAHRIEQLAEGCAPGSLPDQGTREQLAGALDRLRAALSDCA
jgi:chemotaxis protein histidine kinase CheA